MTNIFNKAKNDASSLEEELLGPTYPYWKDIRSPGELGMSGEGSWDALNRDVDGLIDYVEVLVTGQGRGSKTDRPLGNKFFLPTGTKCRDVETKKLVPRYMYINNVPDGNIPFISSGMGRDFDSFEGLIPGILTDLGKINPMKFMQALTLGENPPCKEVTLEVINNNNDRSSQTRHILVADLGSEGFENMNKISQVALPDDPVIQFYYLALGIVIIYILFCLMNKQRRK